MNSNTQTTPTPLPKHVFLSFNLENDRTFVTRIRHYLMRQPGLEVFLYDRHEHGDRFDARKSVLAKTEQRDMNKQEPRPAQ